MLDEIMAKLDKMTPQQIDKLEEQVNLVSPKQIWYPHPENKPQCNAYYSKADILLYGGQPGGGKTGLLLGNAVTKQTRSLIVRKQFTDLEGIIDNLEGMINTNKGIVRGNRPKYKGSKGEVIYFQGMGQSGDIDTGKQGNAFDFIGIDEGAQLTEVDVRLLMGWNRTTVEGQRCRVIIASNPPTTPTGDWLGSFFRPWFDRNHPNPAKFGELRWFYFDEEGKSVETKHDKPFELDGTKYHPQSRTYIPASVEDNPYINSEEYKKNLQSIPEPFRTMLLSGNFLAARKDQLMQLIPNSWIQKAVARWEEAKGIRPYGVPMCSVGIDCAGGGIDNAVIARRYDFFFEPLIKFKTTTDNYAAEMAGEVIKCRKDRADISVDMGGGYGSGVWHVLKDNIGTEYLKSYKGGERPTKRSQDGKYMFANTRTQAYWEFKDAMDPSVEGNLMAIPEDVRLLAGLAAPTFDIRGSTIHLEKKEDVKKKLGYSPDEADAVIMAWWNGRRGLVPETAPKYNPRRNTQARKMVDKYANRR